MKKYILYLLLILFITSCKNKQDSYFYFKDDADFFANNTGLSDTAFIGKQVFFDTSLSVPSGMSCASCHSPSSGFSDPRHSPFSVGADNKSIGNRNAITIAYNAFAPIRHGDMKNGVMESFGGFFWDGRALLMIDQAFSPLFNKDEMNNTDFKSLANTIRKSYYYKDIKKLYEKYNLNDDQTLLAFVSNALVAFEQSKQVNSFTSKFDFYLAGKVKLTDEEMQGFLLFQDTAKTQCITCHTLDKNELSGKILFTDFSYDNIGVPKNTHQNSLPLDSGLGGIELRKPLEIGKFKSPSLRNVAISAPYMHNGVFNSLEEVLEFYNERDINPKFKPEYPLTMNTTELGNLKLSQDEIDALIAFLKTLTDGYKLQQ
ncbi:MAG: c-type cytochrome [Chitinophagales bacterium]|nr:c-type cytochrome [Chitinophagales bacterium]